jgi:hypothetical protein
MPSFSRMFARGAFDGLHTDYEKVRDLFRSVGFGDQLEDLELAGE